MTTPRVVLDTNIALSALLFNQGPVSDFRSAWMHEHIVPLTSRETVGELIRVLAYPKFKLTDEDRDDLLGDYLPWCETVEVPDNVTVPDCRDPHDTPFLELAAYARADALVTGDKDLLVLSSEFSLPIMSPAAFGERFGSGLNR